MKAIYNAGSMFTETQWNGRKIEGENLRKAFPEFNIYNPVDFDTNTGISPTPLQIWNFDYQKVQASKYLIFELDSFDTGTIMEFAIAVEMAKTSQPEKVLIPVISDFRYYQQASAKQLPEFSMNHFVFGAIFDEQLNAEQRIYLAKSHQDAIEIIKNHENYLKTQDQFHMQINQQIDMKNLYDDGNMYKY